MRRKFDVNTKDNFASHVFVDIFIEVYHGIIEKFVLSCNSNIIEINLAKVPFVLENVQNVINEWKNVSDIDPFLKLYLENCILKTIEETY